MTIGDTTGQSDARHRRRRRRWTAAIAVVGITALIVGCDALERQLVYPARHFDRATFEQRVSERYGPDATILAPFDAVVVEPATAPVATALWFHGNGKGNTDFAELAPLFRARGVRLVLAEYPGYGARAFATGPVMLVVAGKDRVVGTEGGRRLARLVRPHGTTTLVELPDADHNDWLQAMSPALWDAFLADPRPTMPASAAP